MAKWSDKPIKLLSINKNIDYIMCIDENGCSNIENARKKILNGKSLTDDEKYFTITGCIFTRDEYLRTKDLVKNLKLKYWKNGQFTYKNNHVREVCFHSREIRRHDLCFNESLIDYESFMNDLSETLKNIDCKIISITMDIKKYIDGKYTYDVYNVAFDLLLERYIYATKSQKKGVILLESRGHEEDFALLKHIKKIINKTGEKNINRNELGRKIKGIYFNPKWNDDYHSTFTGLEITDLFSYPLYKYIKFGTKDKAFVSIENKIVGYPKYNNKGIKIFPSKRKKSE